MKIPVALDTWNRPCLAMDASTADRTVAALGSTVVTVRDGGLDSKPPVDLPGLGAATDKGGTLAHPDQSMSTTGRR